MTILPGETACLACLMADAPPPGTTPTCDTAGILGPIVGVIASIEAAEALKILSGHREAVSRRLTIIDLWDNQVRARRSVAAARQRRLPRVQARRVRLAQRRARRRVGRALWPQRRAAQRAAGHDRCRSTSSPPGSRVSARFSGTRFCCGCPSTATCSPCFPTAARSSAARTTSRPPARVHARYIGA